MPAHRSQDAVRLETERHDGLSSGVGVAEHAAAGHERTNGGRWAKGASTDQSKGGRSPKGSRLTHSTAEALPVSDKLKRRARFMRRRTCSELARDVGGGRCGILGSAMAKLASEDLALREAALERGDVELAMKLGASARSHLLFAREVVAKDARAREQTPEPPEWLTLTNGDGDADGR
jgi:hypothetical protein